MTRPQVAKVIVDVPVKDTDRPFDYSIPESMRAWIEVGSRVGVPFGHRTVQGFVVALQEEPSAAGIRLKPIQEVLDVVPPLSAELVKLAEWMSRKYACRFITALQAMVPTALKGKAERYISLGDPAEAEEEDEYSGTLVRIETKQTEEARTIMAYVAQKGEVPALQLSRVFQDSAETIKAMLRKGVLQENQSIKDKLQKKNAQGG